MPLNAIFYHEHGPACKVRREISIVTLLCFYIFCIFQAKFPKVILGTTLGSRGPLLKYQEINCAHGSKKLCCFFLSPLAPRFRCFVENYQTPDKKRTHTIKLQIKKRTQGNYTQECIAEIHSCIQLLQNLFLRV